MDETGITVSIVNHTHWDREWYFSVQDALVLSDQLFTHAIEELERHPEASFTLDGQLSIVNEYVAIHPEMLETIQKLVKNGQLFIGPWYTQADALHTQGESIIRNGMIGSYEAQRYQSDVMHVGYLPDTFGFNAQLPVILRQLDINSFVFWRGFDPEKVKSTYFKWFSLSGKSFVYAINMPQGYGTGMLLDATDDYVNQRLDPAVELIEKYSRSREVLIPSGNDQMNIITDFSKKITKINEMGKYSYKISDYPSFIRKVVEMDDLSEYRGEFLEPVLARVHRTCGSSRMDIKISVSRLEQKLLHQVEPMAVIAARSGMNVGNGLLINNWKKLLESQAHDSLAGSISDSVAEDVLHRLNEGNEIADSIINTIEKQIADSLQLTDHEVLVFNTDLHDFSGVKHIRVVSREKNIDFPESYAVVLSQKYTEPRENALMQTESGDRYIKEPGYYTSEILVTVDLPALGYRVLRFKDSEPYERLQIGDGLIAIQNDRLAIEFADHRVNLKMKNGQEIKDCIYLEDIGNAGDTYDFSPMQGDQTRKLQFNEAEVQTSKSCQVMTLRGHHVLPLHLEDRLTKKTEGFLDVKVRLLLLEHEDVVRIHVAVNNQIFSHRLRFVTRTSIHSSKNIASVPYGYLEREYEKIEKWEKGYAEKPVSIWPLDNNVSLSTNEKSVTVFSNDLFEYEHIGDEIALTLFATTDQLGKPDLMYRPGRASGDTTKVGHIMMPTPQAQLIGPFDAGLAVRFSSKAFHADETERFRRQLPLETPNYQSQYYNLFLNRLDNKIQSIKTARKRVDRFTVLSLPKAIHAAACYPAYYDPAAFIIRLENVTEKQVNLDERIFFPYQYKIINALEKEIEQDMQIPAFGVLTLELKSKK